MSKSVKKKAANGSYSKTEKEKIRAQYERLQDYLIATYSKQGVSHTESITGKVYFTLALKPNPDLSETYPDSITGKILTGEWFDTTSLEELKTLRYVIKDIHFLKISFTSDKTNKDLIQYDFYAKSFDVNISSTMSLEDFNDSLFNSDNDNEEENENDNIDDGGDDEEAVISSNIDKANNDNGQTEKD